MDTLRQHVAVIVPSTRGTDMPLPQAEYRKEVASTVAFLSGLFGGATAIPATGGWLSGSDLVTEDVTVVVSFAKELSDHDIQTVIAHASELKNRLRQEAVSVLVNGGLLFVE